METLRIFLSHITVEPVFLLFSLTQGLYIITAQSLYVAKVCNVNFNFSREICDNIFVHPEEQIVVQKKVAELQAYNGILQAVPAVLYALTAGPWSDLHGRKFLIVWSSFGYIFNNAVYLLNAIFFEEIPAEFMLFECLQDCTGGYVCFFLACYSYIADISTKEERTKRLAFLDGLFPLGFFAGMSLSAVIKEKWGFEAVFAMGIGGAVLCVTYALFLKDSGHYQPVEKDEGGSSAGDGTLRSNSGVCKGMFDLSHIRSAFHSTFRKRRFGMRKYILLLSCVFAMEIFLENGKGPTMFLFFRKQFQWEQKTFATFLALFGLVGLFTQYVAVPFLSENLKLHDTTIGILGVLGCGIQQVIMAFAHSDWLLYLGGVIAFLGVSNTTTCRSLVTKCVGSSEVGKVFAVMGALQAMVPLVASPVYGFMYKSTVQRFPGAFLIFSAVLYLGLAILLMIVNRGLKGIDRNQSAVKNVDQ